MSLSFLIALLHYVALLSQTTVPIKHTVLLELHEMDEVTNHDALVHVAVVILVRVEDHLDDVEVR